MTDISAENTNATDTHAETDDGARFFWAILIVLLAVWAGAIAVLGVPGIFLPALALVPVIMGIIVMFSWG